MKQWHVYSYTLMPQCERIERRKKTNRFTTHITANSSRVFFSFFFIIEDSSIVCSRLFYVFFFFFGLLSSSFCTFHWNLHFIHFIVFLMSPKSILLAEAGKKHINKRFAKRFVDSFCLSATTFARRRYMQVSVRVCVRARLVSFRLCEGFKWQNCKWYVERSLEYCDSGKTWDIKRPTTTKSSLWICAHAKYFQFTMFLVDFLILHFVWFCWVEFVNFSRSIFSSYWPSQCLRF